MCARASHAKAQSVCKVAEPPLVRTRESRPHVAGPSRIPANPVHQMGANPPTPSTFAWQVDEIGGYAPLPAPLSYSVSGKPQFTSIILKGNKCKPANLGRVRWRNGWNRRVCTDWTRSGPFSLNQQLEASQSQLRGSEAGCSDWARTLRLRDKRTAPGRRKHPGAVELPISWNR